MRKTRENNQCVKMFKCLIINNIYSFGWIILDSYIPVGGTENHGRSIDLP